MADVASSEGSSQNNNGNASAIYLQTNTDYADPSNFTSFRDKTNTRNDSANQDFTRSRGNRSTRSKTSKPQLFLNDVLSKEKRRIGQANLQFETTERSHSSKEVQTNFTSPDSTFPTERRLDGKAGSIVGLLPRQHRRKSSPIPSVSLQESGSPNDKPTVRSVLRSQELCSFDELGNTDSARPGYEDRGLLGRFSPGEPVGATSRISGCGRDKAPREIGVDHQLREIDPQTDPRIGLPGTRLEYEKELCRNPSEEDEHHCIDFREGLIQEEALEKGHPSITRHVQFREFRYAKGKIALSTASAIRANIRQAPTTPSCLDSASRCAGPKVVDRLNAQRSYEENPSSESDSPLPNDRCGRLRMGRPDGRSGNLWEMEPRADGMALQLQRNVRDNCSHSTFQAATDRPSCGFTDRQSNGCRIYKERRGNAINSVIKPDLSTSENPRQVEHLAGSGVPTRQIQRHRRPSIERQTSDRMAFATTSAQTNIPEIWNPTDRPVCIRKNQNSQAIRDQGPEGCSGTFYQRFQPGLEVPACMGVSASEPHPPSTTSSQLGRGDLPDGGTVMEESLLASRSSSSGSLQTNEDQEFRIVSYRSEHRTPSPASPGHETISLEDWGWGQMTSNWSEAEKSLLKSSWRESTLKTYKPAWARWQKWCSINKYDFRSTNGNILAKYLSYLCLEEKLAYSTILVHKSVVASFCQTHSNEDLNSHFLVKHILKAISLHRPKLVKSSVWDPSDLIAWLQSNNPVNITLFEASRRLACILLLASGRRVHDLTLLKITADHYLDCNDHIILIPIFGSKTDTASYRQSGWKLLMHDDTVICPVYWIRKVIELGKQRRRPECKDALFITINGHSQAASRTIIGNWVKSMLKDAGIQASSGSVRSAVASLNWYENTPIEEILSRGNWRRENTFAKFYRKQIIGRDSTITQSGNTLSSRFEPIS